MEKKIPSKDDLYKTVRRYGRSGAAIKYKVSPVTISRWAREYKLNFRKSKLPPADEIAEALRNNNVSTVAEKYGVTESTIYTHIRNAGLSISDFVKSADRRRRKHRSEAYEVQISNGGFHV